jgi:hypothetical protein
MAAEASRAPTVVRERPIAPLSQCRAEVPALRIFTAVPPRFGVHPVDTNSVLFRAGDVAVFDELWASERQANGPVDCLLEDGAIYVTESQRPPAGMTWEMWWAHREGYCPSRLEVRRSIVRVARSQWSGCQDKWMIHPLANRSGGIFHCSDGPYDAFQLTNQIVGKVVGIYCPAALSGSAQS